MRLLFVITKYYPKIGGTPNCTRNLINHIKSHHEICVLTTRDAADDPSMSVCEDVPVCKVTSYDHIALSDILKNKRYGSLKRCTALFWKLFYRVIPCEKRVLERKYRKQILALNAKYHFDWVIAVAGDIYPAKAVLACKKKLSNICFYQLDPYTTNKTLPEKSVKKRLETEKQIYNGFDLVFTTQIIHEEMQRLFAIKEHVFTCNFPNITDRTAAENSGKKEHISCLFCGAIYAARNVDFCVDLIERITALDKNIVFDFYILGNAPAIKQAAARNDRIRVHDPVPPQEIFTVMNAHDILINIGNVMTNQIPSKIYDYISTGLPIVNLVQSESCPTIPVLDTYGLSKSISVDQHVDSAAHEALQFILDHTGMREDYTVIQNKFKHNTIECVADLMLSKMQCGKE